MNMEKLLKAKNGGHYTPYDLAQYVFWTGDEAGVAQAIQDLIDEGLVSIPIYLCYSSWVGFSTLPCPTGCVGGLPYGDD